MGLLFAGSQLYDYRATAVVCSAYNAEGSCKTSESKVPARPGGGGGGGWVAAIYGLYRCNCWYADQRAYPLLY